MNKQSGYYSQNRHRKENLFNFNIILEETVKSGFMERGDCLEAKYHMAREENIFVAKRNIVEQKNNDS